MASAGDNPATDTHRLHTSSLSEPVSMHLIEHRCVVVRIEIHRTLDSSPPYERHKKTKRNDAAMLIETLFLDGFIKEA